MADNRLKLTTSSRRMVAVAASDGRLDSREIGLIQQVYQDQIGARRSRQTSVARAAEA